MTRLLGLDVGDVRIGVALSDPLGLTAQRLTVLVRQGLAKDLAAVRALVEQHGVSRVIIGMPLTMQGERGPQAHKVEAFATALERAGGAPITFVDERLTTVQGERMLRETGTRGKKRKQVIDQIAAQLILQQYLDTTRDA
jgi:putative holliday junction resolvase